MSTKSEAGQLDNELLEKTALQIYTSLAQGRMRGYAPATISEQAFSEAKAFALEAQAIRDGKAIAEPKIAPAPAFVLVHLWDGARGQHGEPKMDENTGQPITEQQPVDHDAYAPNLPDGHPINQRYYPNAVKNGRLCDRNGKLLSASRN